MPYCTQTDIETVIPLNEIIQMTNDTPGGTTVDESILTGIIAVADGIIDGYLQARYSTLPLSPVPVIIKEISKELSAYKLYQRRVSELPESVRDMYKNSMRLLEKISSGQISLGITTVVDTSKIVSNKTSEDRMFNQSLLDQY